MIKQKTVEINGTTYQLTQFPGGKGIGYSKRIAKFILPAFSEMVQGEENENVFGKVIQKVWENLDLLEESLIKELVVTGATKGNMAINFDMEFAGNYVTLFELLKEIILFNFEDVFTYLGSAKAE